MKSCATTGHNSSAGHYDDCEEDGCLCVCHFGRTPTCRDCDERLYETSHPEYAELEENS